MIQQATKNGFSIDDAEINSQGIYKGFSIFRTEKRKKLGTSSGSGSTGNVMENCYTKRKIDLFRQVFPNNLDQSDPKYFRGFQPGDLEKAQASGKIIYVSEKSVRENKTTGYY